MTPAPVSTSQIPVAPPVPQFDDEEQARLIDLAVPIIKKVIEYLIDRFPMFAQLLLERLRIRVDFTCYAAWTNGVVIAYNPHWVVSHTALEVAFLIAHEIMHNLMCHTIRRKGRNSKLWNVAGDYCINSILAQYQVGTPPGDAVIDVAKYDGNKYLTEQVYDMLLKAMPPPPPQPPPGEGTCEGSNPGSHNDLGDWEGQSTALPNHPGHCEIQGWILHMYLHQVVVVVGVVASPSRACRKPAPSDTCCRHT